MKKIGYFLYVLFFVAFITQIWWGMSDGVTLNTTGKILIVSLQVFSLLGAMIFTTYHATKEETKKRLYITNIILFVIYIGNLGYMLFFDSYFGRTGTHFSSTLMGYINQNVNLIPFKSICLYIDAFQYGTLTWRNVVLNIVGNGVIFMPFAYFLPFFFKRQRNGLIFLLTIILLVLLVECAQVITQCGAGDIDDLILNVSGMMIAYYFIKIPVINRFFMGGEL